jgi:four helix bundle protein
MGKYFKKEIKYSALGYESLKVFQMAFEMTMDIFEISKRFPKEETYSLTDQVRRSSRSVCANIGEGYRKRIYPKSFVSKMADSDGECSETMIHLKCGFCADYISEEDFNYFQNKYDEIGRMLSSMIQNPEKFLPKK